MKQSNNVMILTQCLSGGGAEKLAANLSLGLRGKANVLIVTYWQDEKEYEFYGKRINLGLVGTGKLEKFITAIKRIRAVRQLKKNYHIDFTVSYVPHCDYVNVLSRLSKEKILIDVVSNMSTVFPRGLSKRFRRWVLHQADFLITVSEGVRQDLIRNFGISPEKSETIYNSCDVEAVQKECREKKGMQKAGFCPPDHYISAMGSFRHAKGHWHLIKAFYTIKDEIPGYHLVILGDGAYRNQYEALIRLLGLEDRVSLPGFINPPHGIISDSELFVFPSVYEGFGNAVIEAMACGTPVVSVDCDYGPREILAPKTSLDLKCSDIQSCEYGILSPPFGMEDIDITNCMEEKEIQLGKAMLAMLKNEELRNSYRRKGLSYCREFDNEAITGEWIKVCKELCKDE